MDFVDNNKIVDDFIEVESEGFLEEAGRSSIAAESSILVCPTMQHYLPLVEYFSQVLLLSHPLSTYRSGAPLPDFSCL